MPASRVRRTGYGFARTTDEFRLAPSSACGAPLGPSETAVTLTYDWSAVPQSIREYLQFPPFGPAHLTNSLRHLAELAAPVSPDATPGG